jgi:hypothetical protein
MADSGYLWGVTDESTEDEIPRLPRGRGLQLSWPEIFKILMLAATLVGLLVLQKPCASSVAKLVTSFDGSGSATMPKPSNLDLSGIGSGSGNAGSGYVRITPDMTPEQIKQAIDSVRR